MPVPPSVTLIVVWTLGSFDWALYVKCSTGSPAWSSVVVPVNWYFASVVGSWPPVEHVSMPPPAVVSVLSVSENVHAPIGQHPLKFAGGGSAAFGTNVPDAE